MKECFSDDWQLIFVLGMVANEVVEQANENIIFRRRFRISSCDQCHIMIEQRRKTDKLSGFYITQQTEICCMSVGICNDRIEKNHPYKIGFCLRTKLLKLCKNIFVSLPDSI